VREDVLQRICELEGIDITKAELNMSIDNEFRKTQYLATQVEGVAEARLFALLCSERLHWFQVHVIVKMQVVQVLRTGISLNIP